MRRPIAIIGVLVLGSMLHQFFEPGRPPRRSSSRRVAERFGKDAAPGIGIGAAKSPNRNPHLNGATLRRQIQKPPLIAAVHPLGLQPAVGAPASTGTISGGDENAIGPDLHVVDQQTGWRQ